MDTKARKVRCPRCWSVLLEPSEVLLYECGGCGAKLQVKKQSNSTVDTTRRSDEESSRKQKVGRVFVDQEAASSSNQQSLLNSTNESPQNGDHNDLHSSNKDQDAAKIAENGTVDAPSTGVEEFSSEKLKMKQLFDDQEPCCSSNQQLLVESSDEPDQNVHNDPRSSTEFSGHEDPESSPEATTHNSIGQEQDQKRHQIHHQQSMLNSADKSDQNSDCNDQDATDRAENDTIDAPPSGVEDCLYEKPKMKQLSDDQELCCRVKSSDQPDQHTHKDPPVSIEFSSHENPESSPEATTHNAIEQPQEQNQKQNQIHYKDAVVEPEHSTGNQKIKQLSDNDETGTNTQQLLAVNSMNELDRNNDHNEHRTSSKLSYHDEHNSSPEATLHNRHETEIEDSSSEFEEPVANTNIISDSNGHSKSTFRSIIAEKLLDTRPKKSVQLDEDDLLSEDEIAGLHHRRRFSRISSVNYYGYEGSVSSFDENDDQNPRKNRSNSGNMYRFNRRNDLNRQNSRYSSPMISENPNLEKLELLKLVRELQDQIERTNVSNLYDHALNNPGRFGRRMAFSGEATAANRPRDGGACRHCRPGNRLFAAQLSHHKVCCNGPIYGPNNELNYGPNYGPKSYHSPGFSGQSSPKQNHAESKFSASDDYRQRKKKQYVRPIAHGAPWVTCYLCSKLLQLPQSFLLFNKRYHKLRCGACLKVLTFTLSNGSHVSRYYPEEAIVAPPSSEVEDFDRLNGPVSCSDRSFEKSYSTETDRLGSREFSEERRKATVLRNSSGSTRPSTSKISGRRKTASEIEEVEPGPNGSTLHWLMGYASPSKVIRG